jgi:glyoxylase-like metal-dependent hydrolase (beta-lactamase superfamily II)
MTQFLKTSLLVSVASLLLTACNTSVQTEAPNESQASEQQASEQTEQEPVWDANKIILEAQKLSDGVFAVIPTGASELAPKGYPIATSGGFVIGDEGVLVIESMLNKRLNAQLFTLIRAETDKPITHLVNTSYHGDHAYGNFYVPDAVNIIQHEKAADYIENHFVADTEFMMQNFGKGRGIEDIRPVKADTLVKTGESLTIDLGGKAVVITDYGFAQTGGDLFVSVPGANVLWTGNPVLADAPALPWLLDGHLVETHDTLEAVYNSINADTKVVPGHGPVTDRSAIKWHVDYLAAVRDNVQLSIDAGMTLEQTVEKLQMPDYQGYALFGWVHPSLNIPAAYKDLSGQ